MQKNPTKLDAVGEAESVREDPKITEEKAVWDAKLERERTRSWLAKSSLVVLFPGIVASAAYGFFSGDSEVYLLTVGLATPATMIVKSYFPTDKETED